MTTLRAAQTLTAALPQGAMAVTRWPATGPATSTVLGVHGITAHGRSFQRLADALPDLEVVAPDLRGRGRSRHLPPASLSEHGDDMARLLDRLAIERAVVVGHSMGGFVAVHLAHRHADRVAGLVLVDGGLPLPGPATLGPALDRLRSTFADREAYRDFWRQHPAFGPYWDAHVQDYVDHDLRRVGPLVAPSATPEAVALNMMELDSIDRYSGLLTSLRVPVTFVHAGRDLFDAAPGMYPPEHAHRWLSRLRDWRVIELVDDHHYGVLLGERGARTVADAVLDTVSTRPASSSQEKV